MTDTPPVERMTLWLWIAIPAMTGWGGIFGVWWVEWGHINAEDLIRGGIYAMLINYGVLIVSKCLLLYIRHKNRPTGEMG